MNKIIATAADTTTNRRLVVVGEYRQTSRVEDPDVDRACTRQAIYEALIELGVENPHDRSRNAKLRALREAQAGVTPRLSQEVWKDLLGGMGVLIPPVRGGPLIEVR